MIEKNGGRFTLVCDNCGERDDEDFSDFQDAVDFKKSSEWSSKKQYGEWFDICPKCKGVQND